MSFDRLLATGRLRPRKTRREDIQHLLQLVQRDLEDAAVPGLSADRRFLIAYDAALALATIPMHCGGCETHGTGHHWMTFQLLPHFMGEKVAELATYFDSCRTKRNLGTCDRGGEITESEADELNAEVQRFRCDWTFVFRWVHDGWSGGERSDCFGGMAHTGASDTSQPFRIVASAQLRPTLADAADTELIVEEASRLPYYICALAVLLVITGIVYLWRTSKG